MIPEILSEILKILLMVFTLMVLVKYLKLRFKATIRGNILKKPLDNYTDSSFFGSKFSFIGVSYVFSFCVHGMVDFGSLAFSMMSNVGDEAFSMDPRTALLIFAICLLLGIIADFLADWIFRRIKFSLPYCLKDILYFKVLNVACAG